MSETTTQLVERLTAFGDVEICRLSHGILSLLLMGTELTNLGHLDCINSIIIEETGAADWTVHSMRNSEHYLCVVLHLKKEVTP